MAAFRADEGNGLPDLFRCWLEMAEEGELLDEAFRAHQRLFIARHGQRRGRRGDQALRLIADAISHTVGGRGETGRLGGEEFAVFMPGCSLSEGEDMAARINRQVAAIDLEAIRGRRGLTVSIGVAHASAAMRSEDLLAFADTLLYEAKRSGRNRYASVRTASVMETANGKNPAFAPAA